MGMPPLSVVCLGHKWVDHSDKLELERPFERKVDGAETRSKELN